MQFIYFISDCKDTTYLVRAGGRRQLDEKRDKSNFIDYGWIVCSRPRVRGDFCRISKLSIDFHSIFITFFTDFH